MNCESATPLLDALMDGELLPPQLYDVEDHVRDCAACSEQLHFYSAVRRSTKNAVDAEPVPSALTARIQAAISDARDDEQQSAASALTDAPTQSAPVTRLGQRAISAIAIAAAVLLYFGGSARQSNSGAPHQPLAQTAAASAPAAPGTSVELLLDRLLDFHATPPPLTVTDPAMIARFEPDVGVRVQVPDLQQFGGMLQGGSVVPIRAHRAVHIRYRLSNHNVTLYVYNSARVPVHKRLKRRIVRDRTVYVGERRGYHIAVSDNNGIGYAIATDLSDRETAELVATVY